VPWRLYSNSRRAALPGTAGLADFAGLLPKVRVVAGHPRLDLPGFQIERRADPPALRGRDGHAVRRHLLGQRLHRPTGRAIRGFLGDEFDEQQHVVVVIDARTAAALEVIEAGEAELRVTLAPDAHLVVVQIDDLTDLAVGTPVGRHQHDARPLRDACFHGSRTSPRLENRTVTPTQFQWR
jgi:hypothetical protein